MEEVKVEDAVEQDAIAEEKQEIAVENSDQFGLDVGCEAEKIYWAGIDGLKCIYPQRVYSNKYFIKKNTGERLTTVGEICHDMISNKVFDCKYYFQIFDNTDGCAVAEFQDIESSYFCGEDRVLYLDNGNFVQINYSDLVVDSVRVVTKDNGEYLYTEYVNCGETKEAPDIITRYRFEKEWTETVPSLVECDGPAATGEL